MKKLFFLSFLFCTLNVFSVSNRFTINGKIEGVSSGTAELSFYELSNNKFENIKYTSFVHQGIFLFKGNLKEPVRAELEIGVTRITFYLEPQSMDLYISKNLPNKFKLNGSKTQNESDKFEMSIQNFNIPLTEMKNQFQEIFHQLDTIQQDNKNYKTLVVQKEIIFAKRDSILKLRTAKEINFIRSNRNSYYPALSNIIVVLVSQGYLSVDSATVLFNHLSEKIRNSVSGKQTYNYLKIRNDVVIGKMAPNFVVPDMNGELVNLSDYQGKKYVLLDFWASWCIPCLKGLPHMKELFEKYNDKGLQIIGVSCDQKRNDWLASISKNKISIWPQVLTVQSLEKVSQGYVSEEDIQQKYPTDGVPKYILIDKTGKIIGKWVGYSVEDEKDQDILLKKIFETN